jgi:hypothetical protein
VPVFHTILVENMQTIWINNVIVCHLVSPLFWAEFSLLLSNLVIRVVPCSTTILTHYIQSCGKPLTLRTSINFQERMSNALNMSAFNSPIYIFYFAAIVIFFCAYRKSSFMCLFCRILLALVKSSVMWMFVVGWSTA